MKTINKWYPAKSFTEEKLIAIHRVDEVCVVGAYEIYNGKDADFIEVAGFQGMERSAKVWRKILMDKEGALYFKFYGDKYYLLDFERTEYSRELERKERIAQLKKELAKY